MDPKFSHTDPATGVTGLIVYLAACICLIAGFMIPPIIGIPLTLFAFIPVFYGSHEALHFSLFAWRDVNPRVGVIINEIACAIGFALQGMNFRLLRPAHIAHHALGRYEEGYAPDVAGEAPAFTDYVRYYITLLGLPAFQWQAAGFLSLAMPPSRLPISRKIPIAKDHSFIPTAVAQLLVIGFWVYAIAIAGPGRATVYLIAMSILWSLLQNVAHYGLKGFDPATDRVCAHTYILQTPFRYITFGSLSHLAHHVDMHIPGLLLQREDVAQAIEQRLAIKIKPKHGIIAFIIDILRQFRGPLPESALHCSWIQPTEISAARRDKRFPIRFHKRQGREWRRV